MACMAFETGRTFSPSIKNPGSSATGLIQFMASTAIGLNTTVDALAKMSAVEQLDYVARYFEPYRGRLKTLADTYMAILWPAGVGKPDDHPIFGGGSPAYLANKGLDANKDGNVTKAEAAAKVAAMLAEGLLAENAADAVAPAEVPIPPTEKPMGALALLQLFGPILSGLIPQIASFLKPGSEVAARNVGIAQTIVDTITTTAQSPNLQAAIEKMQDDPGIKKAVQEAIVTQPEIIGVMEIGGGIKAAREFSVAAQNAEKPFWFNPAFWVTLLLLPLVYWIVGAVLVGGVAITETSPWYVQMFRIFGTAFNEETRAGTVNLVIGMVLGGIVGIWFGTSYGSMRKTELAAEAGARNK